MHRILLIDDDPAITGLIRELLEDTGYRVWTARDGREGLAAFDRDPPDLVVTDIVMTRTDGLTVIRELRQRGWSGPILAISGGSPTFAVGHLLRIAELGGGADAVLNKPFEIKVFLQTVANLLARDPEPET